MIETDKQPKKLFLVYVMAVVATSNRYRPQLHTTSAASAWLKEQADSSPAEQRADSPWSEAATSTDRTALISFDRSTSRPSLLLRSRLGTVQLTGDAGRDYDGRPRGRRNYLRSCSAGGGCGGWPGARCAMRICLNAGGRGRFHRHSSPSHVPPIIPASLHTRHKSAFNSVSVRAMQTDRSTH